MKKRNNLLYLGLMACMLITSFSFTSCEKEIINKSTVTKGREKEPNRLPVADGVITMSGACGEVTSCGPIGAYGYRYNRMTFTKTPLTISVFPTLRYSIYKHTSGVVGGASTYTKIAEFTCNLDAVKYGSGLLENATSHYLVVTTTDTPSPASPVSASGGYLSIGTAFPFTTGNEKTGLCGGLGGL